ncbi:MAG: CPBP family intramembrane metalloprotease, partial [Actinobacteria bacterium]|nr:CPBP family intramembrane metalloprotease [Actinomycetota bacterium]
GWSFWIPASPQPPLTRPPDGPRTPVASPPDGPQARLTQARAAATTRRGLLLETWFVQLAFLLPGVVSAIDTLAAHLGGHGSISFFPTVVRGHPVENLVLTGASYLAVGAVVPLALLLLARTGHLGAALGLRDRGWRRDLLPGLGIAAAGYGTAFALSLLLSPVLSGHHGLITEFSIGPVPAYYILYGVLVAAVTGITEETLVNGYLLTRLEQLGASPRPALLLSLALRTSYHLYYGIGLIFTIPFGYYATRSFQKRRRLVRPVVAHFLYDATLITISVLIAHH